MGELFCEKTLMKNQINKKKLRKKWDSYSISGGALARLGIVSR
jgi:hypothetical protein